MNASSPRLLEPGLRRLPPGTERYVVRGGGATVVPLRAGDRLEIVDPEGRQRGEVVAFDEKGNADVGILGIQPNCGAGALATLAEAGGDDARRVAASLRAARPRARRGEGRPPLRAGLRCGRARDPECGARRRGVPRRPRRPDARRRPGPAHRPRALRAPGGPRGRGSATAPARTPRRAAPGTACRCGHRTHVRSKGGRIHPDHRRRRPGVLRFSGLLGGPARTRRRALHRRHRHPHPDGGRLSGPRAALQVLRCRHAAAGRGRAGHRRATRYLRRRVQREVLRGSRLSRPRELLGQLQPRARPLRGRGAAGLDGRQLLLQHEFRRRQPALSGRALVAAGRLRPAPGAHRSGLCVLGLSRRHRRRECLGTPPTSTCAYIRKRTRSAKRLHSE